MERQKQRFVMTDLVDISDHMARACECGCVRFNLLRSGAIECDTCGEKQPNLIWRDNMNHNRKLQAEEKRPDSNEIDLAKQIIRDAINKNQQCFVPQINKENNGRVSHEAISAATSEMTKSKELRLKEDSYEHDWEYILR